MSEIVNVLNLEKRTDRMEQFKEQAKEQGFEYRRWEGFIDRAAVFRGISISHKKIVGWAKANNLERVVISEDDCVFTAPGAWQYYLDNMPQSFDLYLSMVYEGEIDENNRLVKNSRTFSGLTLYTVHNRFYDAFLKMKDLAHIDRELGFYANKYEYYVCNPFTTKQSNGWSDQKKKDCQYDKLLIGRKMFGS